MNRFPLLWGGALLIGAATAVAQNVPGTGLTPTGEKAQPVREIYVPFADLHVILDNDRNRVFLNRQEYEALIARATQRPELAAPLQAAIVAAEYRGELEEGRAVIRGRLAIEVMAAGMHALPLDLGGVGFVAATLDGKPAALVRRGDLRPEGEKAKALTKQAAERPMVLVEGVGAHELVLEMTVPLATAAAQQTLQFRAPMMAATRLVLTAPGDVEVKAGAAVVRRDYDETTKRTEVEVLPGPHGVAIVLSLNHRLRHEERVLVASSVIVDEVTQGYERIHATVSYRVLRGGVERLRLSVPAGFQTTTVEANDLSRWEERPVGQGRKEVEITLREASTTQVVVRLVANRSPVTGKNWLDDLQEWSFPIVEPQEVVGQSAVIGLAAEDRLRAAEISASGLLPIDSSGLAAAIPASVLQAEPGAPTIRQVVSYFAPAGDYRLAASLMPDHAELIVASSSLLAVSERGLRWQSRISLAVEGESLFVVPLALPRGWRINRVSDEAGRTLPMERYEAAGDAKSRAIVRLAQGIQPGTSAILQCEAELTPADWLTAAAKRVIGLPQLEIDGATQQRGVIVVQTSDDLIVRPNEVAGLTPIVDREKAALGMAADAEGMAFRFDAGGYAAELVVERVPAAVTARSFAFLALQPEHLIGHYQVDYDIRDARTPTLQFSLPVSTPREITVRGLDGVGIKDIYSREDGGRRVWTVELAERAAGRVRLEVDFDQQQSYREGVQLPLAEAESVDYQSGHVAVEGHPELEVQIATAARRADIGEMSAAERLLGRYVLGTFGYVGSLPEITAQVTRPEGHLLPPALVERAELLTKLSASGRAQAVARYAVVTKATLLEVRLPERAELWSVLLDGQSVKPQREEKRLLVSLPAKAGDLRHQLQVVFESRAPTLGMHTELDLVAPRLFVRGAGLDGEREVPQVDLVWRLYLPSGYEVVRDSGGLALEEPQTPEAGLLRVGRWLVQLAGGVRPMAMRSTAFSGNAESAGGVALHAESELATDATTSAPQAVASSEPAAVERALQENGQIGGKAKGSQVWALEGVSSLKIDIDPTAEVPATFRGLGEQPRLRGVAVNRERLESEASGLGLLVILIGVGLTRRPIREQIAYVLFVLAGSLVALAVFDMFAAGHVLLEIVFIASCWVAVWFVAAAVVRRIYRWAVQRQSAPLPLPQAAQAMSWLLAGMMACGGSLVPSGVTLGDDEDEDLTPVKVPADVIVIPYDPERPEARDEAGKVLVPYAKYVELWNKAYPLVPLAEATPIADFAISGVTYEATLGSDDWLAVSGRMTIEVFRDGDREVPLGFGGGLIEQFLVDGQPGRLSVVEAAGEQRQRLYLLHLNGRGTRQVELRLRLGLKHQGGWRRVSARLPVGLGGAMNLRVPEAGTELRQTTLADRATWETERAEQTIRWGMPAAGSLDFQWRAKVAAAMIDEALTAQSAAVFDVREDGLRLHCQLRLEFGRSQRDSFTLLAPRDYLLETVQGENVRGWTRTVDEEAQRIEVSLLKAASGTERIAVVLSRREVLQGVEREQIRAPLVDVEGAALHQGELLVRHSPRQTLRTVDARRISQVEPTEPLQEAQKLADSADAGVLQPRPFQAFRFPRAPFRLMLAAEEADARPMVTIRAAVRIGARETVLDGAVTLRPAATPVYETRLLLPESFRLTRLIPADLEWSTNVADGVQTLTVLFPDGRSNEFTLTLLGQLPGPAATDGNEERTLSLPRIAVEGAELLEGELVVLPDPDTEVHVSDVRGGQAAPLVVPPSWMKAEQRPLARSLVRIREAEYSGMIHIRAKTPRVSARSVTNVKVTPRAIEETVLVHFQVQEAGIRRVELLIAERLAKARIHARLVRQQTIEPAMVDGQPAPGMVRLVLDLQDDLRGDYAVLIEHDRPLSEGRQIVTPPVILTGRTNMRLVAIENRGQDEVVIEANESAEMEPVHRLAQAWRELAGVLGEHVTLAYAADDGATAPRLAFHTLARQRTVQATARIGLATTLLVVDQAGAYRAAVQYRVNNETEPYLQVKMPEGATLWTATVAGQGVKPLQTTPAQLGLVRIPLAKTAEGEGDYLVELKYGGQMRPATIFRAVNFPLIQETNLQVEQSVVRLLVPEAQRWFAFSGTMRMVGDEQQVAEGVQSYLYRRIQDAAQALASGSEYTKVRASVNLKQSKELFEQNRELLRGGDGAAAQKLEQASATLLQQAEVQLQLQEARPAIASVDNRAHLNWYFQGQGVERSKDVVGALASNFEALADARERKESVNRQWLEQNQLVTDEKSISGKPQSGKLNSGQPTGTERGMSLAAGGAPGQSQPSRLAPRVRSLESRDSQVLPDLARSVREPMRGENSARLAGTPLADASGGDKAQQGETEALRKQSQGGEVDELRRYQRSLEERLSAEVPQNNAAQFGGGIAEGGYGFAGSPRSGIGGGIGGGMGGMGGGMDRPAAAGGSLAMPGDSAGRYDAAASQRGGEDAMDLALAREEQTAQLSAGLASLDVRLPERGTLYRFTTPRGQIVVQGRAISRAALSKFIVMGLLLAAGTLGWSLQQPAVRRLGMAAAQSLAGAMLLVGLGLGSLLSGVLPVAGLAVAGLGLYLLVGRIQRKQAARRAATSTGV